MPLYDRRCDKCEYRRDDAYEQSTTPDYPCSCGGLMVRIPFTQNPGAIGHAHGDECDVMIAHGLCNADATPRRWRSKSAMAAEAKKRGMTNYVQHVGEKGSDKSKHTQKWY